MDSIDREPTPGTALRTIAEEYEYLKEFMGFVERHIAVNTQYVKDLTTLRNSANAMWANSGIWNLISPLITHLDEEILCRSEANDTLRARYSALPSRISSKHEDEVYYRHLMGSAKYDALKKHFLEYGKCYTAVTTPDGIGALQGWYQGIVHQDQERDGDVPVSSLVLPLVDRNYRQAVCDQREAAKEVLEWHVDHLPNLLESHQQHVEDVKTFIGDTLTDWSQTTAALSISCSRVIKDNHEFSSSKHIAGRHDEHEQERTHVLLRQVKYRQFMLNGQEAEPLLGVRSTLKSMEIARKSLLGYYSPYTPHTHLGSLDRALVMERECEGQNLQTVLNHASDYEIKGYLESCLATGPPLVTIGPDIAKLYNGGVPRDKLSIIMQGNEISPALMYTLEYLGGNNLYQTMDHLLTHSDEPPPHLSIMRDIWRKWDFDHGSPLPKGVERVEGGSMQPVWTKTGHPYKFNEADSPPK